MFCFCLLSDDKEQDTHGAEILVVAVVVLVVLIINNIIRCSHKCIQTTPFRLSTMQSRYSSLVTKNPSHTSTASAKLGNGLLCSGAVPCALYGHCDVIDLSRLGGGACGSEIGRQRREGYM